MTTISRAAAHGRARTLEATRGGHANWAPATSSPWRLRPVRCRTPFTPREWGSEGAPCAWLAYLVAGTSTSIESVVPLNNPIAARILLVLEVTEQ